MIIERKQVAKLGINLRAMSSALGGSAELDALLDALAPGARSRLKQIAAGEDPAYSEPEAPPE
jgi:hypothetical protein